MVFTLWHEIEQKLPLLLLILVVWWFIREEPPQDSAADDDDNGGGTLSWAQRARHPHRPRPRPGGRGPGSPRRGPHGDPAPPTPARIRSVATRRRVHQHR